MYVTFCGHRQVFDQQNVSSWLDAVVSKLILEGATQFYLGGYGDFDLLAAAAVRKQKILFPNIESTLVLPYLNDKHDSSSYDRTTYPPLETVPPRFAILKRNQWMVDQSDVVVAYVLHGWGGAAATLNYTKRKKKPIVLFHPDKEESVAK